MTDTTNTTRRDAVARIARKTLRLETLEERKMDSLDFHELGVHSIREALEEAYDAGHAAKKPAKWTALISAFRVYHRRTALICATTTPSVEIFAREFLGHRTREAAYADNEQHLRLDSKWARVENLFDWLKTCKNDLDDLTVLAFSTTANRELYAVWNATSGILEPFNPYADEGAHLEAFAAELAAAQGVSL